MWVIRFDDGTYHHEHGSGFSTYFLRDAAKYKTKAEALRAASLLWGVQEIVRVKQIHRRITRRVWIAVMIGAVFGILYMVL